MGAGGAVSEGDDGVGLRRGMEEKGAWAVGYGTVCLMGKGISPKHSENESNTYGTF